MNRGGIAAKVEEAMGERFPRGLFDLLTDLVHGDVDVYSDSGRGPFKWVWPVILHMKYSIEGNVPDHALRIVASGDRARMETMLHKFVTELEVAEVPQVQDLIHKRRKVA